MKKFLLSLTFILFAAASLFAKEGSYSADVTREKLSFGTFALMQSRKSGGGLTLAFPVFKKNNFFIRDEVTASLYLANSSTGMLISAGDKLHFGSIKEVNGFKFRTYGYMKCEFGASKDSAHTFFDAPLLLETGGAGGFEFIFDTDKGFFVEFGGGAAVAGFGSVSKEEVAGGSFNGGYVCLTTGYKHYF